MKYCSQCGAPVVKKQPPDEQVERHVCERCDTVHYINPKIIAGCLPLWQDKILLCRRAIEPRSGLWTLPAGFMEVGESVSEAARRETWEEATARMADVTLYTVFSIPRIDQVYLFFRGELSTPEFAPGVESLDVQLFSAGEIPWQELAFPVVRATLEHFLRDRERGEFPVHSADIR